MSLPLKVLLTEADAMITKKWALLTIGLVANVAVWSFRQAGSDRAFPERSSSTAVRAETVARGAPHRSTPQLTDAAPASTKSVAAALTTIVEPGPVAQESHAPPTLAPPAWFYSDRDMYAEVAALDSNAVIDEISCDAVECRVEVRHASADARERFSANVGGAPSLAGSKVKSFALAPDNELDSNTLAQEASATKFERNAPGNFVTAYEYPQNDPTRTIIRVIKSESPEEMAARLLERTNR